MSRQPTLQHSPRPGRVWLALVLSLACTAAPAQQIDEAKVAQVKAAYLLNFLRYTQWPTAAFPDAHSPYRVAVLGDSQVAAALEAQVLRSAQIEGRPIRVIAGPPRLNGTPLPEELRSAHLIYIGGSQGREQLRELRTRFGDRDILTVGDAKGFAAGGGMLGLMLEQGRIVFDANPEALRRTGLLLSSKVLKLANIVEEETSP